MRQYLTSCFSNLRWALISLAIHITFLLSILMLKSRTPINLAVGSSGGVIQATLVPRLSGREGSERVTKTSQLTSAINRSPTVATELSKTRKIKIPAVVNPQHRVNQSVMTSPMAETTVTKKNTLKATTSLKSVTEKSQNTEHRVPKSTEKSLSTTGLNKGMVSSTQPVTAKKQASSPQDAVELDQFFSQLAGRGGAISSSTTTVNSQLCNQYGAQIKQAIQENLIHQSSFQGKCCEIALQLAADGTIISAKVRQGDPQLCKAALRAISVTARVPQPADPALYEIFKQVVISFEL